jgi:hypothetical protein
MVLLGGLMVGMVTTRDTRIAELDDFAEPPGGLNQSYRFNGASSEGGASVRGSNFQDRPLAGDGTDGHSSGARTTQRSPGQKTRNARMVSIRMINPGK